MSETEREFWSLVEAVNRIDATSLNAPDQEPALVQLLDFIQAHPEARETFGRHLRSLALGERKASWYLVPFLMRTLRYPEVLEAVDSKLRAGPDAFSGNHDLRHWGLLSDVRDAYGETWDDAYFWQFYSHEVSPERQPWWRRLGRRLTSGCS